MAPPEPPLSDGVIVLRPWRRDDAPALASIWGSGDDELTYWMDEVPQPYTIADALAYLDHSQAGWRPPLAIVLLLVHRLLLQRIPGR